MAPSLVRRSGVHRIRRMRAVGAQRSAQRRPREALRGRPLRGRLPRARLPARRHAALGRSRTASSAPSSSIPASTGASSSSPPPRDIPGENAVVLLDARPAAARDAAIRHRMEPVALVAHADRARAYEALGAHHRRTRDPRPAVLTIDEALASSTPMSRRRQRLQAPGDRLAATSSARLADADLVVEGEYHVPHQEQAYIENNGVIAWLEEDGTRRRDGLDAVPVLRAQGAEGDLRPARGSRARDADDDRRRVRREGGVPEHDRRSCGDARAEGRPSGADDLRPRTRTWRRRPSVIPRAFVIAPA